MRRLTNERGAVAVIVALLMVVLLGFGALVIDTGAVFQERRELQNGADAAALAIAADCALGDCSDYDATAAQYADDNADDGMSAVDDVTFPTDRTVQVVTSTDEGDGNFEISYKLASVLSDDFTGKHVTASATAVWGAPRRAPALPLTIGQCEYDSHTDADADDPVVIYFHDGNPNNTNASCPNDPDPANQDLPGGFGWLETEEDDNCFPTFEVGTAVGDNGNSQPSTQTCTEEQFAQILEDNDYEIAVPIYTSVERICGPGGSAAAYDLGDVELISYEPANNGNGNGGNPNTTTTTSGGSTTTTTSNPGGGGGGGGGNNGCENTYTLAGFGAFHLTGYHLSGSQWTWGDSCTGDERCIAGYFTEFITYDAFVGDESTNDFGLKAIHLID
jgi:Flp pilus assembly protein TadG